MKHTDAINDYKSGDEFYTPRVAILPLIPFIPKEKWIWCPFDTEKSNFVKVLSENGNNVVFSHICNGKSFFDYEPAEYDYIISNPPFSKKNAILTRLKELNKPFAMLMGINMLNYHSTNEILREIGNIQIMFFTKRLSFNGRLPSFGTAFFCKGILPKDLMFGDLENNNVGKNYERVDLGIKDLFGNIV